MKNKKMWIAVVVLLTICISLVFAVENKTETQALPQFISEKDTLKGLQGVSVLIESLDSGKEKYGLTTQQMQTDVELRLRQNGIKVLSNKEMYAAPGMPYLYVNVNLVITEDSPIAGYSISVQLKQNILLERDPTKNCCGATTWDSGGAGFISKGRIPTLRENIKDQIDIFSNDYLAVNSTR